MLRRSYFLATFLLILTAILIYWNFAYLKTEDIKTYEDLSTATTQSIYREKLSKQARYDVQKDIWFVDEKERLLFRINSEASELSLYQNQNRKIDLIEEFFQMKCYLQDKIEREGTVVSQQVRYFTAPKGTYILPSHRFFAESVNLYFLQESGEEIPKTLDFSKVFLQGIAKKVFFSLSEKRPLFSAYHLKMLLDPIDKKKNHTNPN